MNRYLIVGCARSGTTVTHQFLRQHPFVSALNDEVGAYPFFSHGISAFTYGNGNETHAKNGGHIRLFDAMCGTHDLTSITAYGIKSAVRENVEAKTIVSAAQRFMGDLKIIFVHREDLVAQYASLLMATKTGKWHAVNGKSFDDGHYSTIKINESDFIIYGVESLFVAETFRELSRTHQFLELNYESDILNKSIEECERLFDFLDFPNMKHSWNRYEKVLPSPEKYISNYHELTSILQEMRLRFSAGDSPIPNKKLLKVRLREKYISGISYAGRIVHHLKRLF